jgi:hypothetical protein
MLRAVIRQVLEMREEDGPQRNSFKGQVAAYALLEGPRLPRNRLADLLEVSGPTINHYADATKSRMVDHWGLRLYVEEVTTKMAERCDLIE